MCIFTPASLSFMSHSTASLSLDILPKFDAVARSSLATIFGELKSHLIRSYPFLLSPGFFITSSSFHLSLFFPLSPVFIPLLFCSLALPISLLSPRGSFNPCCFSRNSVTRLSEKKRNRTHECKQDMYVFVPNTEDNYSVATHDEKEPHYPKV